jgi:predicted peroxiredoxin
MTSGLKVSIFLTSAAVDLVRKRAIDTTVVPPLEPLAALAALVKDFLGRGGKLWACTPCVKGRGYEQSDLIDGVEIAGSSKIHELIKGGAATLSF